MHHADLMHLLAGVGDRALRTMTLVLAAGVIGSWGPSWWRTARGTGAQGDGGRATGVMLAITLVLFETRALWPGFTDADRLLLGCIAHVAMLATILAKIYIHGAREVDTFRPRRAALAHAAMLGLCVAFAAVVR